MSEILFFVRGDPKGLKRHRTDTHDRFGRPLPFARERDPSKPDKADFLAKCVQYRPAELIRDPVKLTVVAVFSRPKTHFRTGRYANELREDAPRWHTTTPDASNVLKFVEDALNGFFWKDDKLVIPEVFPIYCATPGVAVHVRAPSEDDYQFATNQLKKIVEAT